MINRVMFKLVTVLISVFFVSACTTIQDSWNELMGNDRNRPQPSTTSLPPDNTMPGQYHQPAPYSGTPVVTTPNTGTGPIAPPEGVNENNPTTLTPANPTDVVPPAPAPAPVNPAPVEQPIAPPPLIEQTKDTKMSINPNQKDTMSPDMNKMLPVRTDNLTPVTAP